ncbi:Crp/Fnr family transcriptional regulator [uncultured Draconibacterium sp.]|uniref:Crp/Fnr family transcriptional regulator n=1 Tax=uncultured Draconibacterium sp. TaxID=1573823 RepID=UPI0032166393
MKNVSTELIPEAFKLKNIRLFEKLSEEELEVLEYESTRKSYKKGTVIYREGSRHSDFYCILRGVVKVYKIGTNGKPQIIRFAQRGDVIAYRSLISRELACTSAKVMEDTIVCQIPYESIAPLLYSNGQFSQLIMQLLCKELRESNNLLTDIAQKSVRGRTAETLLALKEEFGVDELNTLKISITREDLANRAGTVTESLIRVMSEFRNERLLDLPGRKIVFLNTPKLQSVANY